MATFLESQGRPLILKRANEDDEDDDDDRLSWQTFRAYYVTRPC